LDVHETNVLFEHTKRLRAGNKTGLLLEPARDKPQYAWVRHRGNSRSRSRGRVKKGLGIIEL